MANPQRVETQAMRLGLFGGTFDPIHLGHLILAEGCREACGLDRVWFIVAGAPPHKPGHRTAVAHRLEMVRIAIAGHPAFEVSDLETRRPGPHYSVETLEEIHRQRPADELFFLIGADSLADLPHWRDPRRIAALATVVVVERPISTTATSTANATATAMATATAQPPELCWPDLGTTSRPFQRVKIPLIGIASNDLRRRIAESRSIRYQVPRGVEAYIDVHGLYQQ
jgi:nicotinate-nucleotide adenylyltransferase